MTRERGEGPATQLKPHHNGDAGADRTPEAILSLGQEGSRHSTHGSGLNTRRRRGVYKITWPWPKPGACSQTYFYIEIELYVPPACSSAPVRVENTISRVSEYYVLSPTHEYEYHASGMVLLMS